MTECLSPLKMIEAFIKIRFKQFYRWTIEMGLIRLIFLIGLLGFIAFILFKQTSKIPNAYYVSGAFLLMVILIHIKRQDKIFLKIHFINYKLIYLAEYLLLIIPVIVSLIYHFQWIIAVSILCAIGAIVNIDIKKPKQRNLNTKLQQLIPYDCFEWKAGIRKTLFLIITFWMIGLSTSFFIGSVPIVIFILGILPLGFYEKGEPLQMVLAYEMGSNKFLFHKIKMQTILFSVLSIPLMVGFMIFHFERWYIPIAEYFIFISLHTYVILAKYAFYEPNKKSGALQLFGIIGVMGTIIPVLIPVVWLLSIRFYFKSRKNLNFYLNDYN